MLRKSLLSIGLALTLILALSTISFASSPVYPSAQMDMPTATPTADTNSEAAPLPETIATPDPSMGLYNGSTTGTMNCPMMGSMSGMSGTSGMGSMSGMSGMGGMNGMSGMGGMGGMNGMSGMGGMNGMSGMGGMNMGMANSQSTINPWYLLGWVLFAASVLAAVLLLALGVVLLVRRSRV